MNIEILSRASVTQPNSGYGNLFLDSDNGNQLTWKDALGNFHVVGGNGCCCDEDCACELAKQIIDDAACMVKNGQMTATEYTTLVQSLNVVATSVWNEATQTCTKTVTNQPAP